MLRIQKVVETAENGVQGAPRGISADEFCAWMTFMGWRVADVVRALGVSRNTVSSYRQNGADDAVRRACRSVALERRKDDLVEVSFSYPWERAA